MRSRRQRVGLTSGITSLAGIEQKTNGRTMLSCTSTRRNLTHCSELLYHSRELPRYREIHTTGHVTAADVAWSLNLSVCDNSRTEGHKRHSELHGVAGAICREHRVRLAWFNAKVM